MNPNATFGIAITADDKSAKGFNSAEKRGAKTAAKIGQQNKAWAKDAQDSIGVGSRGIIGNLARVEKAAKSAFGGVSRIGSGGGGLIGQLGGISRMAGMAGEGIGAIAGEAGLAEAGLIGLGGAALATGGAVIGLAAGMVKLSDSWGKGANNLGNMASLIGVSTEGLQKFAGAAERVGVDKNTAMGTMGSLSQTLNDARYGRNRDALAVLGKMGVKLQTNQDGTVNVEAMLPAIANAITAQNSSGRRTAAHALGISEGALAAFTQGGNRLKAGMDDYGRNGAVVSDADAKLGRALTERDTKATQWLGKQALAAQRWNATAVKGTGDAVIGAVDKAGSFNPPSLIGAADAQTLPVAGSSDAWGGGSGGGFGRSRSSIHGAGRLSPGGVIAEAQKAVRLRDRLAVAGFDTPDANALAANAQRESGSDFRRGERGGGTGFGLFQWTNAKRKEDFRSRFGHSIFDSTEAEQIKFLQWELRNTERAGWQRAHQNGNDAGSIADGVARHVERPATRYLERDAAERSAVARQLEAIPVHVTVEVPHAPSGTKTSVWAGAGARPAISHAFHHKN